MAVGRIGWVKKTISAVAMIALVFGLSVRPAFAAEAPAGEGSRLCLQHNIWNWGGYRCRYGRWRRCRRSCCCAGAPRQLPESQALSQESV